ncbi:MAG: hypothetical protein Kow006_02360 [Gammaproteobacteria bacterium]
MDLERWTEVETLDCSTVGFRVASALRMTGLRNPDPGPEFTDITCTLNHCTGASKCGLVLPATAGDMTRGQCSVVQILRNKFGIPPKLQLVTAEE